jgi:hypothetical protein
MNFIYDVYLVSTTTARQFDAVAQIPDLVDTPARCGIHLYDIERLAGRDVLTVDAFVARFGFGIRINRAQAIYGFSQDPSDRCLARTSWPAEKIRVTNPTGSQGILQCCSYVLLSNDVPERLWTPFPR